MVHSLFFPNLNKGFLAFKRAFTSNKAIELFYLHLILPEKPLLLSMILPTILSDECQNAFVLCWGSLPFFTLLGYIYVWEFLTLYSLLLSALHLFNLVLTKWKESMVIYLFGFLFVFLSFPFRQKVVKFLLLFNCFVKCVGICWRSCMEIW